MDSKLGPVPQREAIRYDLDASVIWAIDRGIQVAHKGLGGDALAANPQRHAQEGSHDSAKHQRRGGIGHRMHTRKRWLFCVGHFRFAGSRVHPCNCSLGHMLRK